MEISRMDLLFAMCMLSCFIGLYGIWISISIKNYLAKTSIPHTQNTIDSVLADLKRATENMQKLKKTSENHSQLIIKLFQILKDSIESDLSQEEVLVIIKELGLPLKPKEPKIE